VAHAPGVRLLPWQAHIAWSGCVRRCATSGLFYTPGRGVWPGPSIRLTGLSRNHPENGVTHGVHRPDNNIRMNAMNSMLATGGSGPPIPAFRVAILVYILLF